MSMSEHGTGSRQRGAVLIMSLMILVLMTVFGISTMDTNILEEKMAGNMRDRNLAFQAAESALRLGEQWIVSTDPLPNPSASGPIWEIKGPDPDDGNGTPWWEERDGDWWADNAVINDGDDEEIDGVAEQPAYVIEKMYVLDATGEYTYPYLQVTARGVGGSDTTVVVLQSVFKWID